MANNLDFWYDEQIKRYLLQLVRVFSNFQVREYTSSGANYNRVPCRYADASRMVSLLLKNNSENVVNNSPQITVGIQSLQPARDRTQDPFLQDTTQVAEREFDTQSGTYTSDQGNLYTTQRYMPVPYNLTIQVDIWTTNTDTKMQLLEQILVLFNPSIQLQNNSNPLDWSNVFEVEMTDIQWSSRSIPAGVDETLDVATLTFAVPIWISPPAKVQRQKIIQRIVNDIHKTDSVADLDYNNDYYDFFADIPDDAVVVVTPNDLLVNVTSTGAQLIDNTNTGQIWQDIIEMNGELTAGSRLELNTRNDTDDLTELIIGTVEVHPTDGTVLLFTLDSDTLPSDTLSDITRIIDPGTQRPGNGLPVAALGQRYLLTEVIIPGFTEWGGISANINDIIEYNGTAWEVMFDSENTESTEYATNDYTGQQYKWTGTEWISSWQGIYNGGYWRLIL